MRNSVLFLLLAFGPIAAQCQDFQYKVRHQHSLKDCRGILKITPQGVEFQSDHKEDSRTWKFEEIRALEIKSAIQISMVTYEDQRRLAGKDRIFKFTILNDKLTPELSAFLLSSVKKPLLVAVVPPEPNPAFEIRAKHLGVISGSLGVLRIYPDKIIFESGKEGDTRVWRIRDRQNFSLPDRFRFQIVSFLPKSGGPTEVYNFQTLEDLPEGLYDYLWIRLHPDSYYPVLPPAGAVPDSH